MKPLCRLYLVLAIFLAAVSCGQKGRIIPAHKFAKIYAQMLVADQRAKNDGKLSRIADTTLFYEPILNDFGYTSRDYVRSAGHYMENPEDFENIFKETKKILEDHIAELTATERARKRADSIRAAIVRMDFRRPPVYFGAGQDSARIDTVSIRPDSTGVYVWERIMPDTLYHGPAFRIMEAGDSSTCMSDSAFVQEMKPARLSVPDGKILIDTAAAAKAPSLRQVKAQVFKAEPEALRLKRIRK